MRWLGLINVTLIKPIHLMRYLERSTTAYSSIFLHCILAVKIMSLFYSSQYSFTVHAWLQIVVYNEGEVVRGAPADVTVSLGIERVGLVQAIRDTPVGKSQQILVSVKSSCSEYVVGSHFDCTSVHLFAYLTKDIPVDYRQYWLIAYLTG